LKLEDSVKKHHWFGAIVLLVIGYFVGVKYPSLFQNLKAKVAG